MKALRAVLTALLLAAEAARHFWCMPAELVLLYCPVCCPCRRDRLAVVTQLLVPLLLVALAMAVSTLEMQRPQQPPLQLSRHTALMGRPALVAAAPGLRRQQEVQGFMDGYPRCVVGVPAHVAQHGRQQSRHARVCIWS